jgi:hypothetical protein
MLLPREEDFFTFFYCSAFGRHYGDTDRVQHVWLQGKNVPYHAAAFHNHFIYIILNTSVIFGSVMLVCLLKVKFPMRAYPSQIAMMSKIVTSLQRSQNSLLESPTGEADFLVFCRNKYPFVFRSWFMRIPGLDQVFLSTLLTVCHKMWLVSWLLTYLLN